MFLFQEALAHKKAQDTATSMADAIIIFKCLRFLAHTIHTVRVIETELHLVHSLNSAKQKVFNLGLQDSISTCARYVQTQRKTMGRYKFYL